MNKTTIVVPREIKYISDWENFTDNLTLPCILDKKVTGCGFTEWCIKNNLNIILCSPRKILLENKESQHPNEVLYFRNKVEQVLTVDKDLNKVYKYKEKEIWDYVLDEEGNPFIKVTPKFPVVDRTEEILKIRGELKTYCINCLNLNKAIKILVTYDSFRHVKETLIELGILDNFLVIIDEFQSIFIDSRFKPTTELEFLTNLQGCVGTMYVSATPMIEEYLDQIEEFKDLPYYELDWKTENPLRIIEPDIEAHKLFNCSIQNKISEIIDQYRSGQGEELIYPDGTIKKSEEAVFYVNSVKNICDTIRKANLIPEECNILCANTVQNYEKIRKAFKLKKAEAEERLEIGKVPVRSEKNKMFTFCTRTVYLGADFYSTNARTFIFSDANIDCLAVDITLDLPQIMGRQRLLENPWKNKASLYFKLSGKDVPESEFKALIDCKIEETNIRLNIYSRLNVPVEKVKLSEDFNSLADMLNYKHNYIAVNRHAGALPIPVLNKLVMLSEIRAFKIQHIDYKDRCSVFYALNEVSNVVGADSTTTQLIDQFDSLTLFTEKMKLLVNSLPNLTPEEYIYVMNRIPIKYATYINVLGIDKIRALNCRNEALNNEINFRIKLKDELFSKVNEHFKVGDRYTKKEIKEKLAIAYSEAGIKNSPKATDLERFFELSDCKISVGGKREHGFELVSLK